MHLHRQIQRVAILMAEHEWDTVSHNQHGELYWLWRIFLFIKVGCRARTFFPHLVVTCRSTAGKWPANLLLLNQNQPCSSSWWPNGKRYAGKLWAPQAKLRTRVLQHYTVIAKTVSGTYLQMVRAGLLLKRTVVSLKMHLSEKTSDRESWGCTAWRKEGFWETWQWPFSI